MAEKALTVVEQRDIVFHGDYIATVCVEDVSVRSAIKHGLIPSQAARNISVFVMNTQGSEGQARNREKLCRPTVPGGNGYHRNAILAPGDGDVVRR
jgi:hypothetical protein